MAMAATFGHVTQTLQTNFCPPRMGAPHVIGFQSAQWF